MAVAAPTIMERASLVGRSRWPGTCASSVDCNEGKCRCPTAQAWRRAFSRGVARCGKCRRVVHEHRILGSVLRLRSLRSGETARVRQDRSSLSVASDSRRTPKILDPREASHESTVARSSPIWRSMNRRAEAPMCRRSRGNSPQSWCSIAATGEGSAGAVCGHLVTCRKSFLRLLPVSGFSARHSEPRQQTPGTAPTSRSIGPRAQGHRGPGWSTPRTRTRGP